MSVRQFYAFSHLLSSQNNSPGFTSTTAETEIAVRAYVAQDPEIANTKWNSLNKALGGIRLHPDTRWMNTLEIKNTLERVYVELFGEKVVEDKATLAAKAKAIKVRISSVRLIQSLNAREWTGRGQSCERLSNRFCYTGGSDRYVLYWILKSTT